MTEEQRIGVVEAMVVLLEEAAASPGWENRHEAIVPLIARVRRATARRFRRQLEFFLDDCLPYIRSTFYQEGVKKKPPKRAERAMDQFGLFTDPQWDRLIDATTRKAVELGAKAAASDIAVDIVWDRRSPIVESYLKKRSAAKIAADVDDTTRAAVNRLLTQAYKDRWTFDDTKAGIRELWSGFTKDRAELIAITEMGQAFTHGTADFARRLDVDMEKSWLAEQDACPICAANAGEGWIPFEQDFGSGHEAPLAHPRCRCALLTRAI